MVGLGSGAIAAAHSAGRPDGEPAPSPWVAAARPYTRGTFAQTIPDGIEVLKLDSNEGLDPPDAVVAAVVAFMRRPGAMSHYPNEDCRPLRAGLAAYVGCDPGQIVPTCGADGALEAIVRAFLAPGDRAALVYPGYDQVRAFVELAGGEPSFAETGPSVFRFDPGAFDRACAVGGPPKLIYLINPNNPIGYAVDSDAIADIAAAYPASLVVVDETYMEFAPHLTSAVTLLDRLGNLVVVRSFSKAFGLAGLRLGYLVATPRIAGILEKLRNVKAVTALAQVAGLAILEDLEPFRTRMRQLLATREWFLDSLRAAGIGAHGTNGNFVLVECEAPTELAGNLGRSGVRVRDLSWVRRLDRCIRISVTTRHDMERALATLIAEQRTRRATARPIRDGRQVGPFPDGPPALHL